MLEFNGTFLIAITSFLIFMLLMNKILYKPITKIMQKRENFFLENEEKQNKTAKEIEKLSKDKTERISKTQKDASDYLAQVAGNIREKKENSLKRAKSENVQNIRINEQKLSEEKSVAKNILKKEMNLIAKDIAEQVLNKKIATPNFTDKEIDTVLK